MKMPLSQKIIFYLLLTIFAVMVFFPVAYAFLISFMTPQEVLLGNILPRSFSLVNYEQAFERLPLLKYLLNSFVVSTLVMSGQILVCAMAAYVFVFLPFRGSNLIFFLFISTMMIPWEATMIPNFLLVQGFGWTNTYMALTLPFFASAFGTFLLRQHFLTIPYELYEAAQIGGIGKFKFFWKVVLPMSKASVITLGAYSFLTTWNMYLWPLLTTTNNSVRTVQIGIRQLQSNESATDWGVVMAGVMIIILPTLILLFLGQKQLQKGLTQGAIK